LRTPIVRSSHREFANHTAAAPLIRNGKHLKATFPFKQPSRHQAEADLEQPVVPAILSFRAAADIAAPRDATAALFRAQHSAPPSTIRRRETAASTFNGFVASINRPGGNVTGFAAVEGSVGSKWLELLKEIAPRVTRVAAIFSPAAAPYAEIYLNPFKAAAQSLRVEASAIAVQDTSEIESVIGTLAREPDGGTDCNTG
jgi:putative tryptophan/tyrosine transport system substrate-binding protein